MRGLSRSLRGLNSGPDDRRVCSQRRHNYIYSLLHFCHLYCPSASPSAELTPCILLSLLLNFDPTCFLLLERRGTSLGLAPSKAPSQPCRLMPKVIQSYLESSKSFSNVGHWSHRPSFAALAALAKPSSPDPALRRLLHVSCNLQHRALRTIPFRPRPFNRLQRRIRRIYANKPFSFISYCLSHIAYRRTPNTS